LIPTPALPGSGSRVPGVRPISADLRSAPLTQNAYLYCRATWDYCQDRRVCAPLGKEEPFPNLFTARACGRKRCRSYGCGQGLSARPCILRAALSVNICLCLYRICACGAQQGLSARPCILRAALSVNICLCLYRVCACGAQQGLSARPCILRAPLRLKESSLCIMESHLWVRPKGFALALCVRFNRRIRHYCAVCSLTRSPAGRSLLCNGAHRAHASLRCLSHACVLIGARYSL
jgi:hypothetical protein